MDPAALALGVLPLLGGAVQAYRTTQRKFKVFRHASREVSRLRKHLERQQQFFANECHLLLRSVLSDEDGIHRMLDDQDLPEWQSSSLELSLSAHLMRNQSVCQDILTEISAVIEKLQKELSSFDELVLDRLEGESFRDVIRRNRQSVKVAWNKSKADDCIKTLGESNHQLRLLRQQSNELQKPKGPDLTASKKQLIRECTEIRSIKKASKALHDAFSAAWSSANETGELRHSVKLFLDAKVENDVRMDVVVQCHGHDSFERGPTHTKMAWLLVRTRPLDWVEPTPNSRDKDASDSKDVDAGRPFTKSRKVRFADDCHAAASSSPVSPTRLARKTSTSQWISADEQSPGDLLLEGNVCSIFIERRVVPSCSYSSIGYINTCSGSLYRHSFYPGYDTGGEKRVFWTANPRRVLSLEDTLVVPVEYSLDIVDQLKLARNLALAVLKFHKTPWLNEYFRLRDLSLFMHSKGMSKALETLHVGYEFSQQPSAELMEGVDCSCDRDVSGNGMLSMVEAAKIQYGIRNLTLWSLGTLLLQIGSWSRLEAPDDAIAVRKLSSEACMLGPRYQELTNKCLGCDFGFGDDLSRPRLQQAVYEKLVCELNEMIRCLDLGCEDDEKLGG